MGCNSTHELRITTLGSSVTRQWIDLTTGLVETDAATIAALEATLDGSNCEQVPCYQSDGKEFCYNQPDTFTFDASAFANQIILGNSPGDFIVDTSASLAGVLAMFQALLPDAVVTLLGTTITMEGDITNTDWAAALALPNVAPIGSPTGMGILFTGDTVSGPTPSTIVQTAVASSGKACKWFTCAADGTPDPLTLEWRDSETLAVVDTNIIEECPPEEAPDIYTECGGTGDLLTFQEVGERVSDGTITGSESVALAGGNGPVSLINYTNPLRTLVCADATTDVYDAQYEITQSGTSSTVILNHTASDVTAQGWGLALIDSVTNLAVPVLSAGTWAINGTLVNVTTLGNNDIVFDTSGVADLSTLRLILLGLGRNNTNDPSFCDEFTVNSFSLPAEGDAIRVVLCNPQDYVGVTSELVCDEVPAVSCNTNTTVELFTTAQWLTTNKVFETGTGQYVHDYTFATIPDADRAEALFNLIAASVNNRWEEDIGSGTVIFNGHSAQIVGVTRTSPTVVQVATDFSSPTNDVPPALPLPCVDPISDAKYTSDNMAINAAQAGQPLGVPQPTGADLLFTVTEYSVGAGTGTTKIPVKQIDKLRANGTIETSFINLDGSAYTPVGTLAVCGAETTPLATETPNGVVATASFTFGALPTPLTEVKSFAIKALAGSTYDISFDGGATFSTGIDGADSWGEGEDTMIDVSQIVIVPTGTGDRTFIHWEV